MRPVGALLIIASLAAWGWWAIRHPKPFLDEPDFAPLDEDDETWVDDAMALANIPAFIAHVEAYANHPANRQEKP